MVAYIIMSVFVLILAFFIYSEYRNEKKYQKNRHKRAEDRKKTKPPYSPKEKIQKPLIEKNKKAAKLKAETPGAKDKTVPQEKKDDAYELKNEKISVVAPRKVASAKELKKVEEKKKLEEKKLEKQRVEKQRFEEIKLEEQKLKEEKTEPELIPECNYPKFNHLRLVEMGLSEDEAKEFVAELIPQLETQIPLIKEAMEIADFHNMERLTHSIKGSSTTVGTGGISDLLVEFNTYLKTGTEVATAEAYFGYLKHYTQELKKQYS